MNVDEYPSIHEISLILHRHGYEYIKTIGNGGFGFAHLVWSIQYKVHFCAKMVKYYKEYDNSDTSNSELDMLKSLSHPNVIHVYDYFKTDEWLFIILEYCSGGNLMEKIKTKPLKGNSLMITLQQILSAVAYMHCKNIAHRDLKPANILLDKYNRIKLADFGLSIKIKDSELVNIFSGSRSMIAPEVINHSPHDPLKADIWTLGITFYLIATGRFLWAKMRIEQLYKVVTMGIITYPRNFPPNLTKLLQNMLAVDPDKRKTAEELLSHPYFDIKNLSTIKKVNPFKYHQKTSKAASTDSKTFKIPLVPSLTLSSFKRKPVYITHQRSKAKENNCDVCDNDE